jgi:hypothetical protein
MTEPKKYDPRRTMKLDVSDVLLEQPAEGDDETEGAHLIKGPPPLPPSLPGPASVASAAPPAARNKIFYGALFVAMLVVAALGGRKFADVVRGSNAAPAPTSAARPEATAPASAPASAPATVTLPPVEIR